MNRGPVVSMVAVALLVSTAFLVYGSRPHAMTSRRASLESVPMRVGEWHGGHGVPEEIIPLDTSIEEQLARTYENGFATVWVVVGYYPDQSDDARPPAQRLIYPARGWTDVQVRSLSLPLNGPGGGSISATVVLMTRSDQQLAILYWYQLGPSSIASDHWYRARLLYNRLVHGRADVALIRIASPVPSGADRDEVVAAQVAFLRLFYPELLRGLPVTFATARDGGSR